MGQSTWDLLSQVDRSEISTRPGKFGKLSEKATCEMSGRETEKRRCKERIRNALKIAKSSRWDDRDHAKETMEILREADGTEALIQRGNCTEWSI